MGIRKLGEPLGLLPFVRSIEKQIYLLLVACEDVKMNDKKVQHVIDQELERAKIEWYEFTRIHGREPDEESCIECLERFKRDQLPIIRKNEFALKENEFIDTFLENVKGHSLMAKEKFLEEDYQFILSSERYYANKYYQAHAVLEVGYEDVDIRTSHKAQVKGIQTLIIEFEQRFDSVYKVYRKIA